MSIDRRGERFLINTGVALAAAGFVTTKVMDGLAEIAEGTSELLDRKNHPEMAVVSRSLGLGLRLSGGLFFYFPAYLIMAASPEVARRVKVFNLG